MTTYQSEAMGAIHESITGLFENGIIDKQTMSEFDAECLTPIEELTPTAIKAIREKEGVSQTIFARYLNVSKNQVSEWERGKKKPSGTAVKLLTLIKSRGIGSIA